MRPIRAQRLLTPACVPLLLVLLGTGCVRRVHEAPGLYPGSPMAVESSMRVEQFEQGDYEVRVFRLGQEEKDRLYEFIVLERGYEVNRFTVERVEEGGAWALMEHRPDGIATSQKTWPSEPAYQAVRSEVVRLLRERVRRPLA